MTATPTPAAAGTRAGHLWAGVAYGARWGDDCLPDGVERGRRAMTYAWGVCLAFGLAIWAVIGASQLFHRIL
ncbi:hypothetical protein [Nocardioides montaniterrae]